MVDKTKVIDVRPCRGIEGEIVIRYGEYEYIVEYDYFYNPDGSEKLHPLCNPGDEVYMNNPDSKEEEKKELPEIVFEKAVQKTNEL